MRRTKIVATIGPASREPETLVRMVDAGMDVARLNYSHGTLEEHAETARRVRDAAGRAGRPVAILQDLPGPKLRIGPLKERFMDEAADRVEGAVGRAADRVDAEMAMRAARVREHRILRKLSSASAFVKGVRRAVEVWQESADDEDETHPDGGPPPDPSPA